MMLTVAAGSASSLLWGCSRTDDDTPEASAAPTGPTIKVAMSAAFVSEGGVHLYKDLTEYLSGKTGTTVEFVRGLGYETINAMIESGAVDIAFMCGLPYVILHDRPEPAATLIAAPVMKNKRYGDQPKYFSDLIVAKESRFQKLDDLRGATYVFNEEISNSGHNLPLYRLAKAGFAGKFFGTVLRSGSHEESIRMVAAGKADASYVDSLVLEYDQARSEESAMKVRVIDSVGPAGIPPIAASAKTPRDVVAKFENALLAMHRDEKGRKVLDDLLVERFAHVDDKNYDDIREMRQFAKKAGFEKIQ
jgi:phosphonate transport system substrate-binding protein